MAYASKDITRQSRGLCSENALRLFPLSRVRGIDFIDEVCERDYGKSWSAFFKDFIEDAGNLWCPPWIARNYKVVNIDPEIKKKQSAKRAKGEKKPRFPFCNTTVRYVFR